MMESYEMRYSGSFEFVFYVDAESEEEAIENADKLYDKVAESVNQLTDDYCLYDVDLDYDCDQEE